MKIIKTVIAGVLCCTLFSFAAKAQGLEKWADNHPRASQALGMWVKTYPDAAHYIFEWDGKHPERSQSLVTWSLTHPGENMKVFYNQHKNWPSLQVMMTTHKVATYEFLKWCNAYHEAARALMMHPGGLKWAGDHLYKATAHM